jgi:tripartite-type tricarboxylate transporter receptor subunit TctC
MQEMDGKRFGCKEIGKRVDSAIVAERNGLIPISLRRKIMEKKLKMAAVFFPILVVLFIFACPVVWALEYPTKPVNLFIPFGPGGGHDLTARAITPVAQKYLGQPIIIQHKPGGGGAIASLQVAKAQPDGYTLLFGGVGPNCSLPAIEKGRSAGPDDLEGVCQVAGYSSIVVSRPNAPFKNLKEMVEYAKANPGKLIYSTSGPWGATDIAVKMLIRKTGISVKVVPYDGGGPSLLAAIGGHSDVTNVTPFSGYPHIKAGKLVPLAVQDYNRHPEYPDVPTAREQGIDVVWFPWISVNAPKGTSPAIIKKLAIAFKQMIDDPQTREICKKTGVETRYVGTEEFVKAWRAQFEEFREMAKYFKK